MTTDERQQIRLSILRALDANPGTYGLDVDLLHQRLRAEGRSKLQRIETEGEIHAMADSGMISEIPNRISPGRSTYRITPLGRKAYSAIAG